MKTRLTLGLFLALVFSFAFAVAARADPPINVQIEVNFLLGYVEGSGCDFYRNGTKHDSKAAQAHLREKYKYLGSRDMIKNTEEFIEKAATKSSFTGRPYEVRCHDGVLITSNKWLRDELARFRTF